MNKPGRDATLKALKRFSKQTSDQTSAEQFVANLSEESDRGAVILAATMVEDTLLEVLSSRMPTLNSDERSRMFDHEGIAGSFSAKIKLAQGLGIIDRKVARSIDIIREMRNACAHSRQAISFETPELRDAFLTSMEGYSFDLPDMAAKPLRRLFCMECAVLARALRGPMANGREPESSDFADIEHFALDFIKELTGLATPVSVAVKDA